MKTARQVGIVGVGLMGHGIAASLLRAGHQVSFLEHPGNQPVDDLLAAGATALRSGREVAQRAEVVILCVTGSPQVEAVLFEPNGVLEGLTSGSVVVDCSTALPSSTEKVAARVAGAGGRFMDAAMTRTPKEAAEGRLNLIVGAPQALFDETLPLLQGFAENIAHAGEVGAGHTLKLLHNFVSLGFSAVLAEATAASRKAGISDTALLEVLGAGGGGGVILERLRPYIAENDPSGFRFTVANASKDLGYYQTMTSELGVEQGVAGAVHALYSSIDDSALAVPEVIGVLEKRR
ncbi:MULTISPECIES: NAD(P)-dependent oxidoreductase [unclassified Halomonas]|uniref:NAD(P)-dependent oxidoreductase n=1 Tax=unclassified Halomonas TaxID=2609666 RepID=UPI0006DBD695|nr:MULTISPECIES: NAD(P)-dependent oxidoreductase [unclassified Halomonas]KPQ19416.1 MAG: 3-hydroxyisobutyrate dehydrogenase MmsB [Halomonas sp. HL-93]SBR45599.1 3-hydroxyisobutyrate dehydrogenase [Halomonas sp. HL-93]SNY98361.1 3-hydroxyisobutyrate dehydrogenase [Halomonas sp. hl-4]